MLTVSPCGALHQSPARVHPRRQVISRRLSTGESARNHNGDSRLDDARYTEEPRQPCDRDYQVPNRTLSPAPAPGLIFPPGLTADQQLDLLLA